jgi:hypothetical protein
VQNSGSLCYYFDAGFKLRSKFSEFFDAQLNRLTYLTKRRE